MAEKSVSSKAGTGLYKIGFSLVVVLGAVPSAFGIVSLIVELGEDIWFYVRATCAFCGVLAVASFALGTIFHIFGNTFADD